MLSGALDLLRCQAGFNRSTGIVTSAPGMTGDEGLAEMIVLIILGMFLGLLAGILVQSLLRFYSMFWGRSLIGGGWAIGGGVVLGAAISAWLAIAQNQPD